MSDWSRRISHMLIAALGGSVAAIHAADPTPTPTPEPTPVPNTVSLSELAGNFRGRCKVSLDSGAFYSGPSSVRILTRPGNSARVRINAAVNAGRNRVPVDNSLTFTPGGILRGRNLAPGVLKNAPFEGLYTATRRRLSFAGTYESGDVTARIEGYLLVTKDRRFTLEYSIFPGEAVKPAYVYRYFSRPPRK
jgi:hypothetical protein